MKLISMTEKVLELEKEFNNGIYTFAEFTNIICNYANFLNQPLKLEYFVPCDDKLNVLKEPKDYKVWINGGGGFMNVDEVLPCQKYQQAKEKVLFDGFGYRKDRANHLIELHLNSIFLFTYNSSTECFLIFGSTIEDLVKYNLTLTQNAIKQFNL